MLTDAMPCGILSSRPIMRKIPGELKARSITIRDDRLQTRASAEKRLHVVVTEDMPVLIFVFSIESPSNS